MAEWQQLSHHTPWAPYFSPSLFVSMDRIFFKKKCAVSKRRKNAISPSNLSTPFASPAPLDGSTLDLCSYVGQQQNSRFQIRMAYPHKPQFPLGQCSQIQTSQTYLISPCFPPPNAFLCLEKHYPLKIPPLEKGWSHPQNSTPLLSIFLKTNLVP